MERDPLAGWSQPVAIKEWGGKCSPPIDRAWLAHLNFFVHPDVVVAAGRFLLPKFVEHEGGIFLETNFNLMGYSEWRARMADLSEVEKMINHQHVYDLFSVSDEITEESYLGVANLLADTITLALKVCYPERKFCVAVSNTDQDYGPTVSFHSLSSAAPSSGT